jgi:hypothetical protein
MIVDLHMRDPSVPVAIQSLPAKNGDIADDGAPRKVPVSWIFISILISIAPFMLDRSQTFRSW